MGYQKAELIDPTDGTFMTKGKATWMSLPGPAILMMIK